MDVVVTLLITADLDTDGTHTEVSITNVANSVMASILPLAGAGPTADEWRNAVATVIVKRGLQYQLNDIEGAHEGEPPAANVPGGATA